jgi:opacity protein-like surface antigen
MGFRTGTLPVIAILALSGFAFLQPGALGAQEFMDDFMFHQPKATIHFNFGYGVPKAGSDLFDEVLDTYTLEKGDFHAAVFGAGVSFFMDERLDLALEFSFARSSTWSEYTDWVDDQDLPIEQETTFTRVPVTASIRYFLNDRGRAVGNLSWIPSTWTPYIGAGGGAIRYEFEQEGDFIAFDDLSIGPGYLVSNGWSWVGHVFGGVQWAVSPQWVVTAEGRYSLADADLDRAYFSGYDPIDLSGLQATIGFGIRF